MQRHKRLILPFIGLFLFAAETYHSVHPNQAFHRAPSKYFWWSSIPLDSDPLNRHPQVAAPCKEGVENCDRWVYRAVWVDPALTTRALTASALPAFAIGLLITSGLRHLAINEVWSFMISMPVLIFAWFYFVSWLIDRWIFQRRHQT
jgi:hypothetical protein